jgi:hypothetical protein
VKFRSALFCLAVLHIAAASGPSSNDDLNTLKAAQWFALGGIGVATTSKEESAFRSLMHEPDAAGKLKALLSEANLAGQCCLVCTSCMMQLIRKMSPVTDRATLA